MKLTTKQKIGLVFFIGTVVVAYWLANWRHQANFARINESIEREQTLHLSTDKLLANCEKNALQEQSTYDANHQICQQGAEMHEQTSHALEDLNQEKASNDLKWFWNFFLSIAFFNLFGIVAYRAREFIKAKVD